MALLQAPAQGGGRPGLLMVVQFAALIGIFYFLLIRPQRKAQKKHQEVLAALKRGDQVMTEGGILGEVVHLAEDRVTVKSGESRFVVARGKIARVTNASDKAAAS
jgi:preprotein translocase subunit YajC